MARQVLAEAKRLHSLTQIKEGKERRHSAPRDPGKGAALITRWGICYLAPPGSAACSYTLRGVFA